MSKGNPPLEDGLYWYIHVPTTVVDLRERECKHANTGHGHGSPLLLMIRGLFFSNLVPLPAGFRMPPVVLAVSVVKVSERSDREEDHLQLHSSASLAQG